MDPRWSLLYQRLEQCRERRFRPRRYRFERQSGCQFWYLSCLRRLGSLDVWVSMVLAMCQWPRGGWRASLALRSFFGCLRWIRSPWLLACWRVRLRLGGTAFRLGFLQCLLGRSLLMSSVSSIIRSITVTRWSWSSTV